MLPESDRRLLTEFLGECWHGKVKIPQKTSFGTLYFEKCSCGYDGFGLSVDWVDHIKQANRKFTAWQDTGDLKERIVEMGEWDNFSMYALEVEPEQYPLSISEDKMTFANWLMDPIRFPELVAEWLKERKG